MVLQGADSVVQDPQADEISGQLRQYIGVALHDADGTANGLVQLGIRATRLENLLSSVQIDSVLDGMKSGADGFAFAVNKGDGTFAYFPDQRLVGKPALEHGMVENQLKDGYCDYVTIEGVTYYASSAETDDYYLYIAGTEGELMAERVPLTLTTGGIALVCLAVIFLLLAFEPKRGFSVPKRPEEEAESRMFDVTMPSGRKIKTESAASRWLDRSFKWSERTAEQKTAAVVKWLLGASVIAVCVAVVFQDRFFGSASIFSYILGGEWERGLNIFALTACIMFICVAMTVVTVVQKLLNLLSTVLERGGDFVCAC